MSCSRWRPMAQPVSRPRAIAPPMVAIPAPSTQQPASERAHCRADQCAPRSGSTAELRAGESPASKATQCTAQLHIAGPLFCAQPLVCDLAFLLLLCSLLHETRGFLLLLRADTGKRSANSVSCHVTSSRSGSRHPAPGCPEWTAAAGE